VSKGRVIYIPVSPLTTKAEVFNSFRQIEKDIRRPRKVPDLKRLRVALLQKYLIDLSAFHAFKPSDFATAMGSKSKKGRLQWETASGGEFTVKLTAKETDRADRIISKLCERGIPYLAADREAKRQVIKKRWRESKLTPKIRMATQRAIRTLKTLLDEPNI